MQLPDKTDDLSELLPARINEVPLFDPSSDWSRRFQSHNRYVKPTEEWYLQCVYYGLISLDQCVEIDPRRRGGVPVLRGTRVTVAEALAEVADSCGVQEVADNFDLDSESLRCLLNSLSLLLNRPYPK
jgi:uncharacterized protein (DUF433 family)